MRRVTLECLDHRGEQGLLLEAASGKDLLQPDHIIADTASKLPVPGPELADGAAHTQTGDVGSEDIEVLHYQLE